MNGRPENNHNRPLPPPYNPGAAGQPVPGQGSWRPQQPPPPPAAPPWPPRQQPWQPYAPGESRSNGIGTAGFVLSLVSIFVGWVPLIGWLIWILASVLSFIGLFRQPRGLAIAGVIISLVLIPLIVTVLVAIDAFTSAMFLM